MPASEPGAGFELVSGPDLGGGFLHQLSVERFDAVHRFVFHAQDGGADANGPPKGSPEPFGYRRFDGMCALGGRVCWHREFTLPLTDSLRARTAYNRTRFVMEAMLAQAYGGVAVPLQASLAELTDRLQAIEPEPLWYLRGSLALWVRGAPVVPTRALLGTTAEAVPRIADAIREYVTEPAAPTDWDGRPVFGARAFVGTLQAGLRTGWGVPLAPGDLARRTEWTFASRPELLERVSWNDRELRLAPIGATLAQWAEQESGDRLAQVREWAVARGVRWPAIEPWLVGSTVRAEERSWLAANF